MYRIVYGIGTKGLVLVSKGVICFYFRSDSLNFIYKRYILWGSFWANRDLLDISQSKYRRQIGKSEKNDLGVHTENLGYVGCL